MDVTGYVCMTHLPEPLRRISLEEYFAEYPDTRKFEKELANGIFTSEEVIVPLLKGKDDPDLVKCNLYRSCITGENVAHWERYILDSRGTVPILCPVDRLNARGITEVNIYRVAATPIIRSLALVSNLRKVCLTDITMSDRVTLNSDTIVKVHLFGKVPGELSLGKLPNVTNISVYGGIGTVELDEHHIVDALVRTDTVYPKLKKLKLENYRILEQFRLSYPELDMAELNISVPVSVSLVGTRFVVDTERIYYTGSQESINRGEHLNYPLCSQYGRYGRHFSPITDACARQLGLYITPSPNVHTVPLRPEVVPQNVVDSLFGDSARRSRVDRNLARAQKAERARDRRRK